MDGANSEWNCDDKECEIWVKIMHNNSSLTQTHQDDMAYLAYIGESSSSLAEQIGEKLSAAGIKCHVFSDLSSLIENSQNILPDIVLLNPALNDDGEVAQALYRKAPTVVYAGDMDIDDQMVLYQQGVKRVIVDPGSELAGRVHAAANMVLYRRNEVRFARQQSLTHGTVQTFSLPEVLQNALLEQKNLILKIKRDGWDAKLRTFQGHIVNAYTSNLSNEEAVLKTLQLASGNFVIRGYQKPEEFSPMSASTLAILAEARFEQNEIRRFLDRVCDGKDNPRFRVAAPLGSAGADTQRKDIYRLAEAQHPFQDILLYSSAPVLKTVRMLDTLCREGYLAYEGESVALEGFQEKDALYFREHLFAEGARSGSLAILGLPSAGRNELVRTLAGIQRSAVKSMQSIDFVRITLPGNLNLTIFGVSVEETFLPVLEKISPSLIGGIFLIDYAEPERFEFINYLASRIMQIYEIPFVVGLTHVGEDAEAALQQFRKRFNLPSGIEVLPVRPDDFADARQLLYRLRRVGTENEEG